jgi:hypothetical protein
MTSKNTQIMGSSRIELSNVPSVDLDIKLVYRKFKTRIEYLEAIREHDALLH